MKLKFSTAQTTALFYLGLALMGFFSFLFARENLYIDGDSLKTASNLVEKETLARWGIASEVALVGFQALAAVWFFKLFRKRDSFVAGLIAVFGMVNAVIILISSAMWFGALNAALAGQPEITQTLFDVHENIWKMGNLFFGLWLIPMGAMVIKAEMPKALGWFLIAGGIGYMLTTFILIILPEQTNFADLLVIPATIGEFWIIGYLLFKPVRE
ncbi:DUF4386 domain-containing protein [Candidatus Saccharibacteria bacterium]|nr:DUF4386 domain-containing protein [Candidatus Saccharibacteria bacterium]